MTTNGATLGLLARQLRAAGLARINISLDSLDPARFAAMTRRDELHRVLDGIDAAKEAGFDPVKLNTVVQRGRQRRRAGRAGDVRPRAGRRGAVHRVHAARRRSGGWDDASVVGQDEIVERIDAVYPLEQVPARGAAPADRWRYLDGRGTVGVIPSVTKPFCGDCDRVRLTADGQFRTCLFATDEFDLRTADAGRRGRRRARGADRAGRGHQVGRPPHRSRRLRAAQALDDQIGG